MVEIWVSVKNYEGYYEVSNFGRVRSLDRVVEMKDGKKRMFRGQMLKPTKDPYGYFKVHFSMGDKKEMHRLHRLVAEHFIEKPEGFSADELYVNRKINDMENNRVDNLYWEIDKVANSNAGKLGKDIPKKKKKKEIV